MPGQKINLPVNATEAEGDDRFGNAFDGYGFACGTWGSDENGFALPS
jgi:hypothetical protein